MERDIPDQISRCDLHRPREQGGEGMASAALIKHVFIHPLHCARHSARHQEYIDVIPFPMVLKFWTFWGLESR